LCASVQIFDPANLQVRRAAGVFGRASRSMTPGFNGLLGTATKLLEDEDVYQVTRFACTICITMSLVIVVGMNRPREAAISNPFKAAFASLKAAVVMVFRPQLWLMAIVIGFIVFGNSAALIKLFRRPATLEFIHCSAHLFRAMAAATMAMGGRHKENLPFWCSTQAVAAVTRAAYIFGVERMSWPSLMEANLTSSAASVRGALAMEALTILFLFPCILRRRRMVPLVLLLIIPCIAVFVDGDLQKTAEVLLTTPMLMQKASVVLGVMCAMSLFMSGVPGVFSALAMLQAMFLIHRLDTVKI